MRGPAPNPLALRRDRPSDQASWVDLPSRREGPPPPWPLDDVEVLDGKRARLWNRLWTMPQAVMWERNQQAIEVAIHVETLIDSANGVLLTGRDEKTYYESPTPTRALVLRQMKELGLTSGDLMRLRWRIAPSEPAKPEVKRAHGSRSTAASRSRFETIDGGAA